MAEVMANNDWRDFPFVQWTLTLYTDGHHIQHQDYGHVGKVRANASRITPDSVRRSTRTMSKLEEMTYEVVPYDEYNKHAPHPTASRDGHAAAQGERQQPFSIPPEHGIRSYENRFYYGVRQWASAESGTVTVSRNGDDYTVIVGL